MEYPYDDGYDIDEDDYHVYLPPLSQHYYASEMREDHVYRIESEAEETLVTRLLSRFDTKGALCALVVAIAVVVYTHYSDYLRAWKEYYFPPDVSISDSVRVLAFQFLESIHAWIQFIFNGGLWEKFLEWTWLSQREGSFGRDLSSGSSNHGRKEDLPELEYVPPLKGSVVALDFQPKAGEKRPRVRMNTTPLSPAFLDETTYPRGWMVYHRELGVVAKCDADEYDVKRAADDKEEKPVGFDEEKKDESEHGDPLDDDKTLHRSNTSPRQQVSAQQKDAEDDSSSSEENPTSAASFPVLHSIVAGG